MKKQFILLVACGTFLASCDSAKVKSVNELKNQEDTLSYAIGMMIGMQNDQSFKQSGIDSIINKDALFNGMVDVSDSSNLINQAEAQEFLQAYFSKKQEEQMQAQMEAQRQMEEEARVKYADRIVEQEAFLEKNKSESGIQVTASGLQYKVLKQGNGPKPTAQNTVRVHYRGTTIDGNEFDTSYKGKNEPAQFPVNGVIPGWIEALQLMPVGSKWKLFIPSELGYGARGAGPSIPPFSTLIFEVELLDIVSPQQ